MTCLTPAICWPAPSGLTCLIPLPAGAKLFHVGINLAGALSFSFIEGFSLTFMMIYALIVALLAVVVVFARRDLLFTQSPEA